MEFGVTTHYDHQPTLVKQLKLKGSVHGVAVCKNELFVLISNSNTIQVFNSRTYANVRTVSVGGMKVPIDIVSCGDSLFVGLHFRKEPRKSDPWGREIQNQYDVRLKNEHIFPCNSIVRIDFPSLQGIDWSFDDTTYELGLLKHPVEGSLSITKDGNLLLCCTV